MAQNIKPSLFIGCSTEALDIAKTIKNKMFTMQFLTSSPRFIQSNFDTLSLPECAREFQIDAP